MKLSIITVLLCFLFIICKAQVNSTNGYKLDGQFSNAVNKMFYLTDRSNSKPGIHRDSAMSDANGHFTITGKVDYPKLFQLTVSKSTAGAVFYLENSNVKIIGNADSIWMASVQGSREEDIRFAWAKIAREFAKGQINDVVVSKLMNASKTFVSAHSSSVTSLELVQSLTALGKVQLADTLLRIIEKTPAADYDITKKLRGVINNQNKLQVGNIMPDFSQPDMLGNQVLLSSFRGKYVLIDFWASWCHPCRAENPNLRKAYQQYKDKNFTILSISIDKDKAAWTTAVHEDGLPWKQVSDLKGAANEAARLFGVVAVPTNYLIDPNGKIVAVNLRGDALEAKLKEML